MALLVRSNHNRALLGRLDTNRPWCKAHVSVARVCLLSSAARNRAGRPYRSVQVQAMSEPAKRYPKGIEDMGVQLLKGPKVLLTDAERARMNESPDGEFYATPRMMQHAAAADLAALTDMYQGVLKEGFAVLELCASRYSHLPAGIKLGSMVGQGLNEQELAANPDLTHWFIQDLNKQPLLSEHLDSSYDAVLCVNGIQYLTQPELVAAEAFRVLKPGGCLLVAFGGDYFPEKATAGWVGRNTSQRCDLIVRIMQANGFNQAAVKNGSEHVAAFDSSRPIGLSTIIGTKPSSTGGGGAIATTSSTCAENVREWFIKPGLVDLSAAEIRSAAAANSSAASNTAGTASAGNQAPPEHVLERWRGSYEVMVSDAVAMGIPRSVIPELSKRATGNEIQAAVQHLQDMVASFLSSGL